MAPAYCAPRSVYWCLSYWTMRSNLSVGMPIDLICWGRAIELDAGIDVRVLNSGVLEAFKCPWTFAQGPFPSFP
jgi:hypothetical protein